MVLLFLDTPRVGVRLLKLIRCKPLSPGPIERLLDQEVTQEVEGDQGEGIHHQCAYDDADVKPLEYVEAHEAAGEVDRLVRREWVQRAGRGRGHHEPEHPDGRDHDRDDPDREHRLVHPHQLRRQVQLQIEQRNRRHVREARRFYNDNQSHTGTVVCDPQTHAQCPDSVHSDRNEVANGHIDKEKTSRLLSLHMPQDKENHCTGDIT